MIISEVFLSQEKGCYVDKEMNEYTRVSRVLEHFKEEFDAPTMSYYTAQKRLTAGNVLHTTENLQKEQNQVLAEWKEKNRIACDRGTEIHKAIQTWLETTVIDPRYATLIKRLSQSLAIYPVKQCEVGLHSVADGMAGTGDLLLYRTKGNKSVIDVMDFKTNKIDRRSKYGKYLKEPLSHLEECNYNTYAIQLSLYAYMLEIQFGRKIGHLTIAEIYEEGNPGSLIWKVRYHSIPYMKWEVIAMLEVATQNEIIKGHAVSN